MPNSETIASEKQQLYESASLRDDLNDSEATVLLKWGETQVERMAEMFPDDFEKKTRFLRQLLKNINRFVGQREFNDMDGQRKYMEDVVKYLEPLGYQATEAEILAALPTNAKDMKANLDAILNLLAPQNASIASATPPPATPEDLAAPTPTTQTETSSAGAETTEPKPTQPEDLTKPTFRPNIDKTEVIPDIRHLFPSPEDTQTEEIPAPYRSNIDKTELMPDISHLIHDTREVVETAAADVDPNDEKADINSVNQPDNQDTTGASDPNDEKAE